MKYFIILIISLTVSNVYAAQSSYTNFDFGKVCTYDPEPKEITTATCKIDGKPDIYYLEGDLHQAVGFGAPKGFETFGYKNNMHNVIEWRSQDNVIFAAIVRFFINYPDRETFEVTEQSRSQILVIHRVAKTPAERTCIVGFVDARANKDANTIARKVADEKATQYPTGVQPWKRII